MHANDAIVAFFAESELLDREILRPLSHITMNWEMSWDPNNQKYISDGNSYAEQLNKVIIDLSAAELTDHYHDDEDQLAEYVKIKLKWPIRKVNQKWIGADYASILEQGSFGDIEERQLMRAAAGRVSAAIRHGQARFDDMEESHRRMLAAVLSIILYHRTPVQLLDG